MIEVAVEHQPARLGPEPGDHVPVSIDLDIAVPELLHLGGDQRGHGSLLTGLRGRSHQLLGERDQPPGGLVEAGERVNG